MKGQIKMDLLSIPRVKAEKRYISKTWKKELQKYCDTQSQDAGEITGYCVCGEMNYCDFCKCVDQNFPCVKAILKLAKEKNIKIDDKDYDFKKLLEDL